jgi:hypothetical protein
VSARIFLEDTMAKRSAPVTVNFKPGELEELKQLAEQESWSLSQQVRHLVLEAEYETGEAAA